jgi:hypothetical protein
MTAVFVERVSGSVVGVYAYPCNGVAEEELTEDSQEVVSFLNPPTAPIAGVSSRQFKLQLLAAGLLDTVDAWIATQSRAVQIAYEYSGTFVRAEPMMAAGFAAMGFTDEQIDAFFDAASQL